MATDNILITRAADGAILQMAFTGIHGDPLRPLMFDGNGLDIDSRGQCQAFVAEDCSHMILRNFLAHNASNGNPSIRCQNCHDVTFSQVLGWDAGDNNAFPWLILRSQRIRLEDCAGWGRGRKVYQWYCSDDCTAVRCWGRWGGMTTPDQGSSGVFAPAYNCFRTTILDCIGIVESDDPQLVNAVWIADHMDLSPWQGRAAECAVDGCVAICRVPRDAYHIGSPRAITYTNCVRATDKPLTPGSNAGVDAKTTAGRVLLAKAEMQWQGSPILDRIESLAGADLLSDLRSAANTRIQPPTP